MTPTDFNLISRHPIVRTSIVVSVGLLLLAINLTPLRATGINLSGSGEFNVQHPAHLHASAHYSQSAFEHETASDDYSDKNHDDHQHTIRCLTLLLMEYEQNPAAFPNYQQIFESAGVPGFSKPLQSAEILNNLEYRSSSGRFLIRYTTTGTHAVPLADTNESGIPDYVEKAAIYADSSWNYLVGTLGFHDPVPDTTRPILISLRNAGSGLYGYYQANSREIVAHNNFSSGFPPNQDYEDGEVLGRLKVTIAHEFKHAVQFMSNKISIASRTDEISSWMELDATMAEEVVFSTVKDYLNYQHSTVDPSIFGDPRASIPYVNRRQQGGVVLAYNQASFGLYYHEKLGETFWVDVWSNLDQLDRFNMWQAIDQAISDREADPAQEFLRMYLWHYASGIRSLPGYGFKDRAYYPNQSLNNTDLNRRLPFESSWVPFNSRSAMVYEFAPVPDSEAYHEIHAGLFRTLENLSQRGLIHTAIMIQYSDSTVQTGFNTAGGSGFSGSITGANQNSSRPWQFVGFNFEPDPLRTIEKIVLVTANYSSSPTHIAQLVVGNRMQPSTRQFGIVAGNGAPYRAEAEAILDRVVRVPQVPLVSTPLQKVALDVSNNDRLTPFDASLVLRKGENEIDIFPADPDEYRYAPLLTYYSDLSVNTSPIMTDVTVTDHHVPATDILNTFTASYLFGRDRVDDEPIDNILRVYIHRPQNTPFYSIYLDMEIPYELFSFGGFRAKNDSTATLISQFATENNSFRFAFAGSDAMPASDTLITLLFQPKSNEDFSFEMSLKRVSLDETLDTALNISISGDIQINEGVGIREPDEFPTATRLLQSYPNPFNPSATIPFNIAEDTRVRIEVFDLTGRLIQTLTNQEYSPGNYFTTFNAGNLASGMYIVRMITTNNSSGSNQETYFQRITLIK